MTDLAELGIVVKSDTVPQAAEQLKKLQQAGSDAEQQTTRLSGVTEKLSATFGNVSETVKRLYSSFAGTPLVDFRAQLDATDTVLDRTRQLFTAVSESFGAFGKSVGAADIAVRAASDAYISATNKLDVYNATVTTATGAQEVLRKALQEGTITTQQYNASITQLERQLGIAAQETALFGASQGVLQKELEGTTAALEGTAAAAGSLNGLFAIIGVTFGASQALHAADDYNQLQGKLKVVTAATKDYEEVSKSLYNASIKTGTALAGNVTLFQQLSIASANIGINNTQVLKFVENFDKVSAVFKLDAGHLNGTILELSHALEQGTVRAQQFNRLLLDFPALGPIIQKSLGQSLDEIRERIKASKLSSQELFDALQKGLEESAKNFDLLGPRLSASVSSFKLAVSKSFGEESDAFGAILGVTSALDTLAEHGDIVVSVVTGLAGTAIPALVVGIGTLIGLLNPLGVALAATTGGFTYLALQMGDVNKHADIMIDSFKKVASVFDSLKRDVANFSSEPSNFKGFLNVFETLVPGSTKDLLPPAPVPTHKPGEDYIDKLVGKDASKALKEEQKELNKEQKEALAIQKEYNDVLKLFGLVGKENAGLLAAQRIEQFKLTQEYKDASPAFKTYINDLQTGIKTYKDSQIESVKATDALRKFQENYTKLIEGRAKPFIQASEDIQRSLAEGIEKGLREGFAKGKGPLEIFADIIKETLIKTFANALSSTITSQFINPIIAQIAGSVRGQEVGTKVSTKLGVGNTGETQTGGSSLFSQFSSTGSGLFNGVSGGVNNFGASIGFGGASSSSIGPVQAGTGVGANAGALTSSSLTSVLGSAVGGYVAGGAISEATGGNEQGGQIGGSIGAAIGTAILPGIGTIIGSVLGGIVGGLFGPDAPTSASEFAGKVEKDNLTSVSYGHKNASIDGAKNLSSVVTSLLGSFKDAGINVSNAQIRGAINSKQGDSFQLLDSKGGVAQKFGFDAKDADSVTSALARLSVELAKTANVGNESLNIALQNIQTEGRKGTDILNDLSFAAAFDHIKDVPKQLGPYEEALKKLTDTFAAAEEKTIRLGLSLEKLKDYEKEATQRITDSFNASIAGQILAITNPAAADFAALTTKFAQIRSDVKAVGGDVAQVEQLFQLQFQELLKKANQAQISAVNSLISVQNNLVQSYQNASNAAHILVNTLADLRKSLKLDTALSPLSPENRRTEALQQFRELSAQALTGDQKAIAKLPDLSKSLLEASKAYYGNFEGYLTDFNYVEGILAQTQEVASSQAAIADQNLAVANQQLGLLQAQLDALNTIGSQIGNLSQHGGAASPYSDQSLLNSHESSSVLDATNGTGLTVRQSRELARYAGYSGEFGTGLFVQAAHNDTGLASRYNQLVQSSGGRPIAFANGGFTPADQDFIVGEHGPEKLRFNRSAFVTNASDTKRTTTALNDSLAASVRELISEMKSNTQATNSGNKIIYEELIGIRKKNEEIANTAQLTRFKSK
jgi:tape measure domain-containing protein